MRFIYIVIGVLLLYSCGGSKDLSGFSQLNRAIDSSSSSEEKQLLEQILNNYGNSKGYFSYAMYVEKKAGVNLDERIRTAQKYMTAANKFKPNNSDYLYHLAKYESYFGYRDKAMTLLFDMAYNAHELTLSQYLESLHTEPLFDNMIGDPRFERLVKDGTRRIRIDLLKATTSKKELFGNDYIGILTAQGNDGKYKVQLATIEMDNRNVVEWEEQYTIFDYKLGTDIGLILLEDEIMKDELLLGNKLKLPAVIDTFQYVRDFDSIMKLRMSDSEEEYYSSGIKIPENYTLRDLAIFGGLGIVLSMSDFSDGNSEVSVKKPSEFKNGDRCIGRGEKIREIQNGIPLIHDIEYEMELIDVDYSDDEVLVKILGKPAAYLQKTILANGLVFTEDELIDFRNRAVLRANEDMVKQNNQGTYPKKYIVCYED